ncbi:hypothetical protein PspLS_10841 [Pyricularia sp. CBS 133598]|nr:hypothetical protein PspLS_10841 [Pyricularia sp. CBS 133598]
MQYSLAIFAILSALAAAVDDKPAPSTPSTPTVCGMNLMKGCPVSKDGKSRCLVLGGIPLCATICQDSEECPRGCKKQQFADGFCTNGDNPCICSNSDAAAAPDAPKSN